MNKISTVCAVAAVSLGAGVGLSSPASAASKPMSCEDKVVQHVERVTGRPIDKWDEVDVKTAWFLVWLAC